MSKIHWERLDDDGFIVCSGQDTVMNITELQFVKTSVQRFVVLAHGKEDIFCRRCMIRAGMANVKPNGRRAWRKWCKRARLHMNKHHRALYRGAIMRKKQPERTSLPTKPLTARSLVGMTMGARKRAAKSEGVRIGCKAGPKICDKLRKRMWRVWAQAPYARTARTEELAKIWQDMYAKYRIGKRLQNVAAAVASRSNYLL